MLCVSSSTPQARGGIVQELLPAMKLVKYYAWEAFFERNIAEVGATAALAIMFCSLIPHNVLH